MEGQFDGEGGGTCGRQESFTEGANQHRYSTRNVATGGCEANMRRWAPVVAALVIVGTAAYLVLRSGYRAAERPAQPQEPATRSVPPPPRPPDTYEPPLPAVARMPSAIGRRPTRPGWGLIVVRDQWYCWLAARNPNVLVPLLPDTAGLASISEDARRATFVPGDGRWIQIDFGRATCIRGHFAQKEKGLLQGPWELSPDARRIAYWSHGALSVADLDGKLTRLVRLDRSEVVPYPCHDQMAWSPDGQDIAFCCDRGVFLVPSRGGPVHALYRTTRRVSDPTWSPDGRVVAVLSSELGDDQRATIRVLGRSGRELGTWTTDHVVPPFSWFADSGGLVFHEIQLKQEYPQGLARLDLKGAIRHLSDGGAWDMLPADGRAILRQGSQVVVIGRDGRTLWATKWPGANSESPYAFDDQMLWRPDGRGFVIADRGHVWVGRIGGRIEPLDFTTDDFGEARWVYGIPPANASEAK